MEALADHNILIVEPEIGPFVHDLQLTLENAGAESMVARDGDTAVQRAKEFSFTAAVVNIDHADLRSILEIPTLVYGLAKTERSPKAILMRLRKRLAT